MLANLHTVIAQINYTQIGNVNLLHNRIEPFAGLVLALGIVLALLLPQVTHPAGLASLNPGTSTVMYGRGQFWSVRFNQAEDESDTCLFLSCCTYSMITVQTSDT